MARTCATIVGVADAPTPVCVGTRYGRSFDFAASELLEPSLTANNRRFDLSDRLIHFFRDLDLEKEDTPDIPEEWGHATIYEDTLLPAFFLLRHAVREGRLWATWSIRSGRRTIYGPRPAVCFTEMPLAAVIDASRARAARGEAMGTCALVLPKASLFSVGARPVIYALSSDAWPSGGSGMRSFPDTALPSQEQYRYVAYDPTRKTLDWTHEREWRWPLDVAPYEEDPDGIPPADSADLPGLELDQQALHGMGVIVGTRREADKVIHDILTKVDREDISESHYTFIIASEEIPDWVALRGHAEMEQAIWDNVIDLQQFFSLQEADARLMIDQLRALASKVEDEADPASEGHFHERGGCWLWLKDNRHPLVRALVRLGAIHVTKTGRYLVDLPELDASRPLSQREELVAALGREVRRTFGIDASYFSVLDSYDFDAIPSYTDDLVGDPFFYNFSWTDEEDAGDEDGEPA